MNTSYSQETKGFVKLIVMMTLVTSLSACATEGAVREAVIDRVMHSNAPDAASCQCTAVCQ